MQLVLLQMINLFVTLTEMKIHSDVKMSFVALMDS